MADTTDDEDVHGMHHLGRVEEMAGAAGCWPVSPELWGMRRPRPVQELNRHIARFVSSARCSKDVAVKSINRTGKSSHQAVPAKLQALNSELSQH